MNDIVDRLLPGVAAMANIHPLVVHFPVALLTSFLALELFSLVSAKPDGKHDAAGWMLYLGTRGAGAAVAAGLWAEATVPHSEEVHAIMEIHKEFGLSVLSLAVVLSIWRMLNRGVFSRWGRIVHVLLAFVMVGALFKGADFGGLMVYKYGVASRVAEPSGVHHYHHGDDSDAVAE